MSVHNLSVILTGNATSLKTALNTAGREVSSFKKDVDGLGTSSAKTSDLLKMGFAAAAVAVGVALIYSTVQAAAFDREMRNVQSITKVSDAELKTMGKTLVSMSTTLPQSAKTLAEGLYDIASSGFQGAAGLKVLKASAEAASAGLTTTEVSAKAITSVLNAYGRSATDAGDVSDVLFQTVNLGVVSFEELAGTIGDVVGTASAATVGIDEVGSAIATMTLSGISGAEAGTSLNRLLQSMIDPSEELASALRDVGYESGYSALQQDSLSTVMEKLRVASGGNIETLLKWFPEIRAARGALALMANEGRNYIKVSNGIEDADARAGATRAALKDQMKSVSAQFEVFKNKVDAAAITVGVELLPVMSALMTNLGKLASAGLQPLQAALSRLQPMFRAWVNIWGDVLTVSREVVDALGPAAAAFAGLIGYGTIAALNLFSQALSTATGLIADHPALVKAAAVVIGGIYASSLIRAGGATAMLAVQVGILRGAMYAGAISEGMSAVASRAVLMATGLQQIVSVSGSTSAGLASIKAGLSGLGSALFSPLGAMSILTIGLTSMALSWSEAGKQAKATRQEIEKDIDFKSPASIEKGLEKTRAALEEAWAAWDNYGGVVGKVSGILDMVSFGALGEDVDGLKREIQELTKAEEEQQGSLNKLQSNYSMVSEELGISTAAVEKWAKANPDLDPMVDNYRELADALRDNVLVAEKATPKQVEMTEAFIKMSDATSTAKDDVEAFRLAMDRLLGAELDWFDAQTNSRRAMDDFVQSLKDTKAAGTGVEDLFNVMISSGQDNREAISGVASAWKDMAGSFARNGDVEGGIKILHDLEAELREVLKQAGLGPAAIEPLIADLGLIPGNYTALLQLTGEEAARKGLADIIEVLEATDKKVASPTLKVIDATGQTRAALDQWILYWARSDPTAQVRVNGEPARPSQEALDQWIRDYDAKSPEATALLNALDPTNKFNTLEELSRHYSQSRPTTSVHIDDQASPTLRGIQTILNSFSGGRSIPVKVKNNRWGDLQEFAVGGITPAHIAANQLIKYAEPETGGEAYIPRLGNPDRSRRILTEAASWYGFGLVQMASGGITFASTAAAGSGATVIAPEVHVHVGEDVSPMGLAKVERVAKRAALDAVRAAMRRPVGSVT